MAFAELLEDLILLAESIAVSILWVIEHESCLVKNRYLVSILELSALVPSDDSFIDKRPIARKILYNSNSFSVLIFVED